jgi:hypothetical protein
MNKMPEAAMSLCAALRINPIPAYDQAMKILFIDEA